MLCLFLLPLLSLGTTELATPNIYTEEKLLKSLKAEISLLEGQMKESRKLVFLVKNKRSLADSQKVVLTEQHAKLQTEKEQAENELKNLIVEEYKTGRSKSKLLFLLQSESVAEFLRRVGFLTKLKEHQIAFIHRTKAEELKIANLHKAYFGTFAEKERILKLHVERASKLTSILRKKYKLYKAQERRTNQLRLIQLELDTSTQVYIIGRDTSTKLGESRVFSWPVNKGIRVGAFGEIQHTSERNIQINNHGIDILVSDNEQVRSISDGEVVRVIRLPNQRHALLIKHDTYIAVYGNIGMVEYTFNTGQKIAKGEVLGKVKVDENQQHILHFEIWKGAENLDPEDYLR